MSFESLFGQHNPTIAHRERHSRPSGGGATHAPLKFSKLAAAYMAEVAKGRIPGAVDLLER